MNGLYREKYLHMKYMYINLHEKLGQLKEAVHFF